MKHLTIKLVTALVLMAASSATAGNRVAIVDLFAPEGRPQEASGTVLLFNDRDGADRGVFLVSGLAPETRFALQMAQSPLRNSTPTYLLTEFTTDEDGSARFTLNSEFFNSYVTANQAREDANGIAGPGAGALANGGIAISMDFFRVYAADGNATVFGRSAEEPGAAIVLTSTRIPDEEE